MTDRFRLTIAQANPTMGDLDGNAARARAAWEAGRAAGAQMVALPEMFITGWQTRDLALRRAFVEQAMAAVERLARDCAGGPALGIGAPWAEGEALHNAWLVCQDGRITARVFKHNLLLDELRLFDPGPIAGPFSIAGVRLGAPIGEDALSPEVTETLAETGAEILVVPAATPYHRDGLDLRITHMVARVVETGLPLAHLNLTGGQDQLVFDGAGFALNPGIRKVVQLPPFDERVAHLDFTRTEAGWRCLPGEMAPLPDAWEQDYRAMVVGLGDYLRKSGFGRAVLGLSGGIDSALVATIATDALGPANVRGVRLPSEYTSAASLEDGEAIAGRLGIRLDTVPIEVPRAAVTQVLGEVMAGTSPDLTEENIQARLRALILMAISNKFGELLLSTGNKSEAAVGYATIYGDMAGGFNPIADLYKTRVFETCRWRNANHRDWMAGPAGEVIPPRVISKAPSAELRHGQKDEDSLPPYALLDPILEGLVEKGLGLRDLVAQGFSAEDVLRVEQLLHASEWKRHQAALGLRLTTRAFGTDRRYPLVNRWRDSLG